MNASHDFSKAWRFVNDHPKEQIISDASRGVNTRAQAHSECSNLAFLSQIELQNISDALDDEF